MADASRSPQAPIPADPNGPRTCKPIRARLLIDDAVHDGVSFYDGAIDVFDGKFPFVFINKNLDADPALYVRGKTDKVRHAKLFPDKPLTVFCDKDNRVIGIHVHGFCRAGS